MRAQSSAALLTLTSAWSASLQHGRWRQEIAGSMGFSSSMSPKSPTAQRQCVAPSNSANTVMPLKVRSPDALIGAAF